MSEEYIELFERYINKELNQEELHLFEQNLLNDQGFSRSFQLFKSAHESILEHSRFVLKNNIRELQNKYNLTSKPTFFTKWYNWAWMSTAVVLIGVFAFYLVKSNDFHKNISNNNSTYKEGAINFDGNSKNNQSAFDDKAKDFQKNKENKTNYNILENTNSKIVNDNSQTGRDNLQIINKPNNSNENPSSYRGIPVALFSVSGKQGCLPLEILFRDSSIVPDGQIVKYLWDFGDGSTSNLQNPVHKYNRSGKFSVSLSIWTNNNQKAEITQENIISVYLKPKAMFETSKKLYSLKDSKIVFTNMTENVSPGLRYQWNFGDNKGKSNAKQPIYIYQDTGKYLVTLLAINEYNCNSTYSQTIKIVPDIEMYIPTAFSPDDKGPVSNNIYKVSGEGFTDFSIQIFNRSGDLLYKSEDYNNHGWNGKTMDNENDLPAGVYIVKVTITGIDGQKYNFNKTVTLIK